MIVKLILKVGIVCFVSMLLSCNPRPSKFPQDQYLIALYSAHHEAFEELRKMADEDGSKQMFISAFDSTSKLPKSRQQEYNNLLSRISSGMTVCTCDDGIVRFILAGEGCAISSGWIKGIEYIPRNYEKHGVIVNDLDDVSKLGTRIHLRKLEPNWFLFYVRD